MIAPVARNALARSAARRAALPVMHAPRPAAVAARRAVPSAVPAGARFASSSSGSSLPGGSDSLWAISSVVVFGALFVYLTSPDSKGHAKGHQPTPHKKTEDFPTDDEELHALRKTEDQSDHHLEGNKLIASRAHAPDSDAAPTQKKTKDTVVKADDTTFKHGVAAAKDGDHISDPKKVVAAAQSARQEREAKKRASKGEKQEGEEEQEEEENEEEVKDGEDKE